MPNLLIILAIAAIAIGFWKQRPPIETFTISNTILLTVIALKRPPRRIMREKETIPNQLHLGMRHSNRRRHLDDFPTKVIW